MIRRLHSSPSLVQIVDRQRSCRRKTEKPKKNKDRVQRAYFLDRDIDKALRRMALEREKNLTETINEVLQEGLSGFLE